MGFHIKFVYDSTDLYQSGVATPPNTLLWQNRRSCGRSTKDKN